MESLWQSLGGAASSWYQAKLFLEHSVTVSSDALHVMAGPLVQLVAALLLRRPISSFAPWLVLAACTILNETVDLTVERWPEIAMQLGESAKDLALTMLLPTLLLVAARLRPDLFRRGSGARRRR